TWSPVSASGRPGATASGSASASRTFPGCPRPRHGSRTFGIDNDKSESTGHRWPFFLQTGAAMPKAQPTDPSIELIRNSAGEVTLFIDDVQAMQGWEQQLMWRSADLLCASGNEYLEAGLGLGLSAGRIASRPGTRRHVVVEKYAKVIDLFRAANEPLPDVLEIVHADFFDFVEGLQPDSVDGIFFDPELPRDFFEDRDLLDEFIPKLVWALRP